MDIGERVGHVENKIGDFAIAHNELVDAHNNNEEELQKCKLKIADLEDGHAGIMLNCVELLKQCHRLI